MKTKLFPKKPISMAAAALAAVIAVPLAGFASSGSEVQARTSLNYLVQRYRLVKVQADAEISLACMGEVYNLWFKSYEGVLAAQPQIPRDNISEFADAKMLSMNHETDSHELYPLMRPELMSATRSTLAEMRSKGQLPVIPGPMTLTEIYQQAYDTNLAVCYNADYIKTVDAKAPTATNLNLAAVKAVDSYQVSQSGGGGMVQVAVGAVVIGGSGGRQVSLVKVTKSFSLIDWLDEVRAR